MTDGDAAAVRATYVAFIGSGFAFSSWASRIPQVRSRLGLTSGQLGLLLFSIAAGSMLALPLAGPIVQRIGSRRTVAAMAAVLGVGLLAVAVGYWTTVPAVAVGLFLLGFGNGAWDVAMNVHGAVVERRVGRSVMPRFHAGYSLGTVLGALLGVAMISARVSITVHLSLVAIGTAVLVIAETRHFVDGEADRPDRARATRASFAAWREPKTLLTGCFVLSFAFAEGSANDWIGVAAVDGHGASAALGTLVFATFLAAMTLGRWLGPSFLDKFGRVPVVRTLAGVAAAGSALFVLAPAVALLFLGAALWGLGVSLGFPIGMSAGADDPVRAAGRVSVIASIGYCAFLAGPPAIGLLGDRFTVLGALTAVPAVLVLGAALSPVVQAPQPHGSGGFVITRSAGACGYGQAETPDQARPAAPRGSESV